MIQTSDRIFLVYNHWEWKLRTALSLSIRIFTYGPNHAAILKNGQVHEMVGSGFWWTIKKLLGKPVSFAPNEGSGYRVSTLEEWLTHTDRIVIEMKPLVPVALPEITEGYGFLDLIQIFLHIIRTKWLLIGHSWNGTDGCRLWPGMFCSEFVGLALGMKDAHIQTPADLEKAFKVLVKIREFTTTKTK